MFCEKCVNEFIVKEKGNRCTECSKKVDVKTDLIRLNSTGTSFAAHSKVEATIVKPAF